jgi:hypothetical protein
MSAPLTRHQRRRLGETPARPVNVTVPGTLRDTHPQAYLAGRAALVRCLAPGRDDDPFSAEHAAREARRLQFARPTQAAWWAGYADARRMLDSGRVLA